MENRTCAPPLSPLTARREGFRPRSEALEEMCRRTEAKSWACWGHFDSGASLDKSGMVYWLGWLPVIHVEHRHATVESHEGAGGSVELCTARYDCPAVSVYDRRAVLLANQVARGVHQNAHLPSLPFRYRYRELLMGATRHSRDVCWVQGQFSEVTVNPPKQNIGITNMKVHLLK